MHPQSRIKNDFNCIFSNDHFVLENSRSLKGFLTSLRHTKFNPNRACTIDAFYLDPKNPLTLKQRCLEFLHFNLCLKTVDSNNELKVDFREAPVVITEMKIPKTLQDELLALYFQCAMHRLLFTSIPFQFEFKRYILRENSLLFMLLQNEKNWDKNGNYGRYPLSQLIDLVIDTDIIIDLRMPSLVFRNFVFNSCTEINCKITL